MAFNNQFNFIKKSPLVNSLFNQDFEKKETPIPPPILEFWVEDLSGEQMLEDQSGENYAFVTG